MSTAARAPALWTERAGSIWSIPTIVDAAAARWGAALASGEVYQTEFRLRRADGVYRWHLARALPIRGPADEIVRWIGTNTDIQDQKTTAEALAALNETLAQRVAEEAAERDRLWQTSQDLLVVVDQNGIFKAANPAWASVLGWRPEEVVGKHHQVFVHPDDQAESEAALGRALTGPLRPVENRHMHKDGGFRWISWIASPENDLVYATGRDITAEKEAAADLAAAQEALRQSQKMEAVGQLTGGIAHDFNNMLAVVIGSLDLLSRRLSGGDARAQRFLDAANDGARRAALLTQRLLAFSRQQPLAARGDRRQQAGLGHVGSAAPFHRRGHPPGDRAGRRPLAHPRRSQPAGEHRPEPGGQRPRRHARGRTPDDRDPERPSGRSLRRSPPRSRRWPICADRRHGHWRRHVPRGDREGLRSLLHHKGDRQGDGAWPQPGLWLREAVRRSCENLFRARTRHDDQDLPAPPGRVRSSSLTTQEEDGSVAPARRRAR